MTQTARLALLVLAVPVVLSACRRNQTPVAEPTTTTPSQPTPTQPATPTTPTATVDTMPMYLEKVARTRSMLLDRIHFDYDSDELTAEARAKLDDKLRVMNANPQLRIRIEGHCDERGTDEYNLVLGRRRAEQAKRYLTDRGIDASRIETMSFGRERPMVSGSNEAAWSQNRRDEFQIVAGGDNLRPVG